MQRLKTFLILTALIAAYAALLLAAWNATTNRASDTGGSEAATLAVTRTVSEKSSDERLIFPIRGEYSKTSAFGLRESPFTGESSLHYGSDYTAPGVERGKVELQAIAEGTVVMVYGAPGQKGYRSDGSTFTFAGDPVGGGIVEILHDNGMLSRYWHMSLVEVHEGQRVKAGQRIGIMGNTGKTAGTRGHLHFEIILDPESIEWN